MRLLVTGLGGTVAPRFAEVARSAGHEVVAWQRERVSPDDRSACEAFLDSVAPDAVLHLAFGDPAWAGQLAGHCARHGRPFLFTSTTMVFAPQPDGPYTIESPRTATDDYGAYKIRCEDAIWAANPDAMITRLGYQIDPGAQGNNLVAHVDAEARRTGVVRASERWIPACAFLDDTAAALLSLVGDPQAGLHHLDANARTAWTYAQIVGGLARRLERDWSIVVTADPQHDQRMIDSPRIAGLDTRLP